MEQNNSIQIIDKNIQIKKEKRTIGELDLLIEFENKPIHIEIVYKFYLYNSNIGNSFLEHWIGPNNSDHLLNKLGKLKDKQFPLLFKSETIKYLSKLGINPKDIRQQTIFKAQLFVPLNRTIDFKDELNPDCIVGEYIEISDLDEFQNHEFYIPSKLDWLIDVEDHDNWINHKTFKAQIQPFVDESRAFLFWMKNKNNIIRKYFLYFRK